MRLAYAQELLIAVGVGMGLARYRLNWSELSGLNSWLVWLEITVGGVCAGVALVGGLGLLIERARGKSPSPWGPGRWAWLFLASYLVLDGLDSFVRTVAVRLHTTNSTSLIEDFLEGLQGEHGELLIPQ